MGKTVRREKKVRRVIRESADSKVCRGRRAIRESLEKMGRTERPATPISLMPTALTADGFLRI